MAIHSSVGQGGRALSLVVTALAVTAAMATMDTVHIPDKKYVKKWPRGKRHWCCQHEVKDTYTAAAVMGACPNGFVFASGKEPWPINWNAKTIAMLITSVASNAAGLPVAIASFQYGFVHEAAVALATILFSTLYHLGDTLDNDVIGLSPGSWHRLDNVVAIYGFQLIILALSGLHAAGSSGNEQRRTTAELVRTVLFAITMWMQEMGPWNVWCAVGPIVCALLAALLPHVAPGGLAQLRRQRLRSVLSSVDFVAGCAATAAAAVCFAVALEEQRDPLRLLHGCWHVSASAGFFFFLRAVATKDALNVDRIRVVSANESSRASETAKEKVG